MMDLSQRKKKFRLGLITAIMVSLFVHFGLASGVFLFEPPKFNSDRIEVQILEPPSEKVVYKIEAEEKNMAKQVVDQAEKPINDEIDQKAKYLSAHNQKVEKQTRATNHGEFQNTASKSNIAGESGSPNKVNVKDFSPQFDVSKAVHDREVREQQIDNDLDGLKLAEKNQQEKPQQKPAPAAQNPGNNGEKISQSLDYIKELDPGLETLLSTREFVYYTYYARIRRQLNQFWAPKVKEKMMLIYRQGRQIASSEDKITRCLVILDKAGKLTRVQIIGDSGIRELDEAAVEAFKAAAPFPNPPRGIVDESGLIKIRWDFILEV